MARRVARTRLLKGATVKLANNGPLIRKLSWPLLRFKPILSVGKLVVVTRHGDVCELLARDEDFTVAEGNAAIMDRVNGPFILGMDRSPQYLRERSILNRCIQEGDADRIRTFVAATAAELVDACRARGRLDVVQDFARPAAIRLVASYFGIAGPDEATMMRWMRTIFHETFLNVGGDPEVRRAGEASAAEFHAYADRLIATRRSQIELGEPTPDDFLTRLVRLQGDLESRLSDEGVRRNVGGVVVGAVETTSKATAHAIDQLLRHGQALRRARTAASANDMEEVGRYAFEALRFNPINPVLSRHVARATVLAAGTRRERCIPPGRTVYAGVLPAMFDPSVFDRPGEFRADRPPAAYLHFGHGLHTCFGRYVNLIQIPELAAALLRLANLRRAPGAEGAIVYDGPFPDRLLLDFDTVEEGRT
ncbi:MAG TPA: cytochrome P450 [Acidimicrobiales bacterium]|nr:cytochrome P450 [Acidimicrobiales bacterium]